MARYERFMVTKFNPELVEEANARAEAHNIPIPEGGILGMVLRLHEELDKFQVIKYVKGEWVGPCPSASWWQAACDRV